MSMYDTSTLWGMKPGMKPPPPPNPPPAGIPMTKWEKIAKAGETTEGLKELLDKAEAFYLLSKEVENGSR